MRLLCRQQIRRGAKWAADRVIAGNLPEWVAAEAINYLESRLSGHGGMILLDSQGHFGIAHNTPRMAWAMRSGAGETVAIQS
jgi:beta-aspartyl-peptidase (threonine type)